MADNTKFLQTQAYTIAGSGAIIGATTLTLTSFKDIDGVDIAITDFGTKGYATIEPASGEFEESISFTGVSQNANGTATLTGVKNVSFKYPYTETSGLLKSHAGGVTVIITNTAGFYDTFANKNNDETILGTYSFTAVPNSSSAPVSGNDLTNKTYVDNLVNGGVVSMDRVTVSGTAGETLVAGNLVYFKVSDGRWWKTDADTAATVNGVILGIAQGAGTAGVAISSGVLVWGMDSNQSGLSPGAIYYASNTAGGLSASAGTVEKAVGQANTATTFYLNPFFADLPTNSEKDALVGTSGTPSSSNKYVTAADPAYSGTVVNKQSMTAGATITGATLPVPVYQDTSTGKVLACDGNDAATYKFLGFAITNSTDTNPITVQFNGVVSGFSGLSVGLQYFVQDAVGTIGTTPGTQEVFVGVAVSATELLILKGQKYASGTTTFSSTTTTAITLGFRPSRIDIYASAGTGGGEGQSNGGWTVLGANQCSYSSHTGAATSVAGVRSDRAWYVYQDGTGATTGHNGTITTITATGFTLDNTKEGSPANLGLYWVAIGQ